MNGILLMMLMARPCVVAPHIEMYFEPCEWVTATPAMTSDGYLRGGDISLATISCAVNHGPFERRVNDCRAKIDPLKWSAGWDLPGPGGWTHVGGGKAQEKPAERLEDLYIQIDPGLAGPR